MSDSRRPEWLRNAQRVDRPDINRWFKPEDGPIDGTLIWRGKQESRDTGDTYNAYAIREAGTGLIIGVSERAGLRDLRNVRVGSRVYINPAGVRQLDNGRTLQTFEVFAEQTEALGEPTRNGAKGGPDGAPAASELPPF